MMHAYLLQTSSHEEQKQIIDSLCTTWRVDPSDQLSLTLDTDAHSIGIEKTREFMKLMTLKPRRSSCIVGIIKQSELLTTESQNALLKTLEEPPADSKIILCTTHIQSLLPTIVSRCQRIQSRMSPTKQSSTNMQTFLEEFHAKRYGEIVKAGSQFASTKEQAMSTIETYCSILHTIISTTHSERDIFLAAARSHRTLSALKYLQSNVHPQLVFDALFFKNVA